MIRVRFVIAGIFVTLLFAGWGATGHRFVNLRAPSNLPPAMAGFVARASMLADSASNADRRKSIDPTEDAKHYLDIDAYPGFATRTIPHDLDSLIQLYGWSTVESYGFLPWATADVVDSLTAQMRRGDWNRVWSVAADLGHYVADAHNPLHCTLNYNGQYTGNTGIHSRYESGMIDRYQQFLSVTVGTAAYIEHPLDFAFEYIYESNAYVDSIMAADTYAKTVSGWTGSGTPPSTYYAALWEKCGGLTNVMMQKAIDRMADLLYTAWMNAGEPVVPGVTSVATTSVPEGYPLLSAYPNPFNPSTIIDCRLSIGGSVRLSVFDLLGREVAVLVNEVKAPGAHTVAWNAAGRSSGVYYCRMEVQPSDRSSKPLVQIQKLILLQ